MREVSAAARAKVIRARVKFGMATATRAAILIAFCLAASTTSVLGDEEIVLCDLGVTADVRNANASFNLIYKLDINRDGNHARITSQT